jgi:hypothetical protein
VVAFVTSRVVTDLIYNLLILMAGSGQQNLRNCLPLLIVPRMTGVKLEGKLYIMVNIL